MYITNNAIVAKIAEDAGVDWIFIDLEVMGKAKRQGHLSSVISRHQLEDVKKIKNVLTKSKLLVRVNPIYAESKYEIDCVIKDGADIVMLPFFKTRDEVKAFIDYVNGRAQICLLCETAEAVENMDDILKVRGIDLIHIGLNDLHLSYNMKFMFEPLADGTIDMLCNKFESAGIPYGFGGIAQIGKGELPAEYVIAEHYRVGSTMAILARSFCDVNKISDIEEINEVFKTGVNNIRNFEKSLFKKDNKFYESNHEIVCEKVIEITGKIIEKEKRILHEVAADGSL